MTEADGYLSYDPLASIYDRTRVIPPQRITQIIQNCADAARLKDGGLFLDAGVGTGRFGVPLSKMCPGQVVGVDVSWEMMRRAQSKVMRPLPLVRGDLRRLPFADGVFRGALIVHILHLIENWECVLDELRRVIAPDGVLLLGGESGGRSIVVDYYLQQARARSLPTDNLGAAGLSQPMSYLKRPLATGALPRVEWISGPTIAWTRRVPVSETLSILEARAFTQMRNIPPEAHQQLLADSRAYARKSFGAIDVVEKIPGRFLLYGVWSG